MKILHIGLKNYPPAHGGVEKVVYEINQSLKNIEFYIFVEWKQKENKYIKVLPQGILKQIRFIKSYVKENNRSILHFHKEGFIPHSILLSLCGNKVIHTIHGCAWRVKRWSWWIRIIFYILDLLACLFVCKIIFVGEEDFRHFSRIIFWRKLNFVPNGVEINLIECSKDISKCVYIGRISPEKNILRLIEMFDNKNKMLTIFGPVDKHDEFYVNQVMKAIEKNPNVKYGGVLSYSDVIPVIAKYNTLFNISFSEGMPVSVLEAASVGLNLVLSNIPQHRDLNFTDVYYINPCSPVDNSNFSGNSIKNKQHVEKNFPIGKTGKYYEDLYNQISKNQND